MVITGRATAFQRPSSASCIAKTCRCGPHEPLPFRSTPEYLKSFWLEHIRGYLQIVREPGMPACCFRQKALARCRCTTVQGTTHRNPPFIKRWSTTELSFLGSKTTRMTLSHRMPSSSSVVLRHSRHWLARRSSKRVRAVVVDVPRLVWGLGRERDSETSTKFASVSDRLRRSQPAFCYPAASMRISRTVG